MSQSIKRAGSIVGLACAGMLASVAASAQTASFTATYLGQGSYSSSCLTSYGISGKEPTTGRHPVFIWTVGTGQDYKDAMSTTIVDAMVARGFVSASVQYNSGTFAGASTLTGKAKCIYNGASTSSALSKLCARASADCSKGVVVMGLSQGSIMADLARNFDSRVQAAVGFGNGVKYSIYDLTSAVANGYRTLSNTRLRVINGNTDTFLAGSDQTRGQNAKLTGFSCGSTAQSCLQANGSGWYIVMNNQVQDGNGDHCFMNVGGCTSATGLDPVWVNGSEPWSLQTNLAWLQSFTQP